MWMGNVLITGAAGFVGSHTADLLLSKGHRVVGIDNLRSGSLKNLGRARSSDRFQFLQLDVLREEDLFRLCTEIKPDVVVHLAALVSVPESFQNRSLNERLNVDATKAIIRAADATKSIKRIVFSSTAAVYGETDVLPIREDTLCKPLSPYGEAKLRSEHMLTEWAQSQSDKSAIILRYFNIYGPRQDPSSSYSGVISRFAEAIKSGRRPIIYGDGYQTRDFISVADIARANELAAFSPLSLSSVMNVCTGVGTSLKELAQTMIDIMGSEIQPDYRDAREGDIRESRGAAELARSLLGFGPARTLKDGLCELLLERDPWLK